MPIEDEKEVKVRVRLVGNVTGTVYAEFAISKQALLSDPDLYLGYAHLAIPFHPVKSKESPAWPELEPEDTKVLLQARTEADDTKLGGEEDGIGGGIIPFGHWLGTIEFRPGATVEIPNGLAIS